MTVFSEDTIRLLIVDDHEMVRIGLQISIEKDPRLQVVAMARSGADAIELYQQYQPDVVLMDLRMGDEMNGVDATRQILARDPAARIIALTSYDNDALIHDAIEAGVTSYLLKDIPMAKLIEAIYAAYRGESTLAQQATQSLMRSARDDEPTPHLTPAEKRVLSYVARGLSNAEIAYELTVSKSTIKKHVSHILDKLKVSNRAEAAVVAVQQQLIDIDIDNTAG